MTQIVGFLAHPAGLLCDHPYRPNAIFNPDRVFLNSTRTHPGGELCVLGGGYPAQARKERKENWGGLTWRTGPFVGEGEGEAESTARWLCS